MLDVPREANVTERAWQRLGQIVVASLLVPASSYALAEMPLRRSPELDPIEFVLNDVRCRILVPSKSRLSHVNDRGCVRIWHPIAVRRMHFSSFA
jgi:hypothetical protein